ncbi:unnamed protein product [Adineta steineri]|uniref:Uncharacterized protein n=1 Tax=Adineta steineri TaxID=433720 RepID=A0A815EV38_9BILA|nr:unnamed protein product [Adineta steineri]CAF3554444.1 unnamed protein product [Adineta steineri]
MLTKNNASSSTSSSHNYPLVIKVLHDTDGNLMEADSIESVFTRSDTTDQSSNFTFDITSMNQQTITNQLPLLREEQSPICRRRVKTEANSSILNVYLMSKYERDIPPYLMVNNSTFGKMIKKQQNYAIHSVNIDILRKIALLIHREIVIDFERSIWLTYLKCGSGTLQSRNNINNNNNNNNRFKYWPKKLESILQSVKIIENLQITFTDEIYLNVVQTNLQEFENRKRQYQAELIEETKNITNYHLMIEPIIKNFIQKQLHSLYIRTTYTINFIYYEYEYHRLQFVLDGSNLNNDQKQEISHLCRSLYTYQESKEEFTLFTYYMKEKKDLLKVSDLIKNMTLPTHIKIMQNLYIRQQFIEQHRKVLGHYQVRMKKSLLNLAKKNMNEKQKLFHGTLISFQQNQRSLPLCHQLNWIVRNTIQLVLLNITERLRSIYQYKAFELFEKIPLN